MMGGYGYSSEYDMERLVRSSLVSTIYGGTSEIQRDDHRQNPRPLSSGSAPHQPRALFFRQPRASARGFLL